MLFEPAVFASSNSRHFDFVRDFGLVEEFFRWTFRGRLRVPEWLQVLRTRVKSTRADRPVRLSTVPGVLPVVKSAENCDRNFSARIFFSSTLRDSRFESTSHPLLVAVCARDSRVDVGPTSGRFVRRDDGEEQKYETIEAAALRKKSKTRKKRVAHFEGNNFFLRADSVDNF